MHRVDAVGNSPGVRRELAEGIGSLLGWCNEVRQKKIETHRKIIGGSRKAYREFAEGIGMLAGNTPGDRRKKTGRLAARMSEAVGLVGAGRLTRPGPMGKPPVPRYRAKDRTMRRELVGSSLGDSPKRSGSSLGTGWEIAGGKL
ncbi:hypothetical protein GW17_00060547 [Ensete ventricosum]|nr:hypothetical protein GW17_00060547 [Ensete ventricosum]